MPGHRVYPEPPPPEIVGEPIRVQLGHRARLMSRAILGVLPDMRDLHVYGGGALVAAGLWLFWPPAALMAFGLLLIYLGLRRA